MGVYVLRRTLALIPVMLLVSITVFALVRISQGDPSLLLVGEEGNKALAAQIREDLGFNRPIPVQYADWMGHVVRGDLGRSMRLPYQVNDLVTQKLGTTMELAVLAMLLSIVLAIPLGIVAAIRSGTVAETIVTAISVVGVSMPNFWLAVLLVFAFSLALRWLPPTGYVPIEQNPVENLRLMIMPIVTLSFASIGTFARVVHASMADVLWQDYMRTGRAKGLKESVVILRHGLRNALLPLVTTVGIHFGRLLGGAVVVETIFGIPGLGRLMVESITGRDFTVVQGMVLYLTLVTVVTSLVVDVAYAYLDPKIRYA